MYILLIKIVPNLSKEYLMIKNAILCNCFNVCCASQFTCPYKVFTYIWRAVSLYVKHFRSVKIKDSDFSVSS